MTARRLILFGAFDRHNFGDLLFAHIAAAMWTDRECTFAGLAERDLRPFGGHRVRALASVAAEGLLEGADLLHVGGEVLTCSAWQAAVMLLPSEEAQATIAYLEHRPAECAAWARHTLGLADEAPYVQSRARWPGLRRVAFDTVGGVGLADGDAALRTEVLAKLAAADHVGVRDTQTLARLRAAGIAARLSPDPAAAIARLFGERIEAQARQGEVARLRRRFPQGYFAVQCSGEFGDDATLDALATQLAPAAAEAGCGVALFRAGTAPWHDDLGVLERLAARLPPGTAEVFGSLDLWDVCALLARCHVFAGSSLHGRIVAMAYARPRVSLRPLRGADKPGAYAATWDLPALAASVPVDGLAQALRRAQAEPPAALQARADELAARRESDHAALRQALA